LLEDVGIMDVSFAYQREIAKLMLFLQILPAFLMLWILTSISLITEAGFNVFF